MGFSFTIELKEVKMKIIDLTHTISEDMLVYPGTEKPKLTTMNTI